VKLELIIVGKDRGDPLIEAADEYLTRTSRMFQTAVHEVREEPATKSNPLERVRSVEAERIQKARGAGGYLIALDEGGKVLGSTDIAERLRKLQLEARQLLCFVIGGPNGLDPALLKGADERWSLSKLTLPHRLARLVLAEQLYRATTILRGEPYHR
jgi:23S rRNA (pseudouridine1915-N3)-methyltransferase